MKAAAEAPNNKALVNSVGAYVVGNVVYVVGLWRREVCQYIASWHCIAHVVESTSDISHKKLYGVANPGCCNCPLYCNVVALTPEEKIATVETFCRIAT